jgi:hypothetical protein
MMTKAAKKAQKLGADAVAQKRGGIKVRSTIKAGDKWSPIKWG